MKHGGTPKFKYKRVKIYWVDIVSNSEWMSLDKAKDQVYSFCEDTGYLLYKDKKKLIIFASHSFDDDGTLTVGNTTVYPRSVVKKIEVLKWPMKVCLMRLSVSTN